MDEQVSFTAFCNLCEHLSSLGKVEQKKQKLSGFVDEWRKKDPKSLFLFFRLLLPHLDHDRENYGIKEAKIADIYITALGLPKESHDSYSLRSWMQTKGRDFGQVLQMVLERRLAYDEVDKEQASKKVRVTGNHAMSLRDLDMLLDDLGRGVKSSEERKEIFLRVSAKLSPVEQKWLIRIVLKSLRLGLPDNQILKLLHPDAPALFDICMDLRELINVFTGDRPYVPGSIGISLFRPFRPMLAEREVLEQVPARMSSSNFLLEPKLDGERCQLHYLQVDSSTGKYRYWSRHGTEFTFLYGQDRTEGSLTPKIESDSGMAEHVQSAVLDGEMVAYDAAIEKYLPFGALKTSAGHSFDDQKTPSIPHPCLVVFDIVYLNGSSLLNKTLKERVELLKTVVRPIPGFFEQITRETVGSVHELTSALDAAILDQVEGLIVKDPESTYLPGKRDLKWIKLKPEYVDGLCDDLDVVIIDAYYSRTGSIAPAFGKPNAFLCGIWNEDRSMVHPFVKLGSGYNSEEWYVMMQRLDHLFKPYNPATCHFANELSAQERPDLLVSDPHASIVIQIKGAQLCPSESFATCGLTLRHPRFVKLRLDKTPESSLSLSELRRLFDVTSGTLVRKSVADTSGAVLTRRVTSRKPGKMAEAIERAQMEPKLLQQIEASEDYLKGYEFMVVYGSDFVDKLEIEKRIIKAGGKIRQSPPNVDEENEETLQFLAISGKHCGIRINNLKKVGKYDIINLQWLDDCEAAHSLLPLEPKYYIHFKSK